MSRYLLNLLIGLDQLVNVMLGGAPDITISSRCWQHRDHWAGAASVKFIDFLFRWIEKDHCEKAYADCQVGMDPNDDVWK